MRTRLLILTLTIAAGWCPGQERPPAAGRRPAIKSPEVLADGHVVFRLAAPKAGEVSVSGEWIAQGLGTGGKLEKDEQGVWSITIGPLPPDVYSYAFMVDGVRILDPVNTQVKPGIGSLSNLFEVPGKEAAFEDAQDVPHGELRTVWYRSTVLDSMRSMRVYTPAGYDSGEGRYPVLYLLHGSGDDDAGWSTIGRANFILDNLVAAKQAKPMIVVMPNGSMPRRSEQQSNQPDLFSQELLHNIMPYVEQHYRTIANRESRAIAGLSMGGGQTLRVAPSNIDKFAYIGVFSAGMRSEAPADFQAFLSNADATNKLVKLFWIGVGEKDQLTNASAKNLAEILHSHGIKNEFHESPGAHTWINWRQYLDSFAQLLFR
jgi:enterochelin esterase-like enzyme